MLNPCSTCGADPFWANSVKLWRCSFCNKAGYAGDFEGKGWNAINSQPATGELSKFKLPNRQENADETLQTAPEGATDQKAG